MLDNDETASRAIEFDVEIPAWYRQQQLYNCIMNVPVGIGKSGTQYSHPFDGYSSNKRLLLII